MLDITIVVTTHFPEGEIGKMRLAAGEETILSWQKHLKYAGKLHLHIEEDGLTGMLVENAERIWKKGLVTYSGHKQGGGVGRSLNYGYRKGFETSPIVAYFVDDWKLTQNLDLTPWVKVMEELEGVGMVRLGMPHPNLTGRVLHLGDLGWGLLLDDYSFAYGMRPAIYHKRFYDFYGDFTEGNSSLECERLYSERVNSLKGPKVMLALPHPWEHIYTVSMSDWEPK